jgi:hypothetical protein
VSIPFGVTARYVSLTGNKNKNERKYGNLIIVFGLLASVMFDSIFLMTFYLAYFNGGASMVTVNR